MTTIREINAAIGAETDSVLAFLGDFGFTLGLDDELDEEMADFVGAALRITKQVDDGGSVVDAFENETGVTWDSVPNLGLPLPSAAEARAIEKLVGDGDVVEISTVFSGTADEVVAYLCSTVGDEAADNFAAQVAAGAQAGDLSGDLAGGEMKGEAVSSE